MVSVSLLTAPIFWPFFAQVSAGAIDFIENSRVKTNTVLQYLREWPQADTPVNLSFPFWVWRLSCMSLRCKLSEISRMSLLQHVMRKSDMS